jgi:hypothetical protein
VAIQATGHAYDKVDKVTSALEHTSHSNLELLRRSAEVREALKWLWLQLIEQAVEDEITFDERIGHHSRYSA